MNRLGGYYSSTAAPAASTSQSAAVLQWYQQQAPIQCQQSTAYNDYSQLLTTPAAEFTNLFNNQQFSNVFGSATQPLHHQQPMKSANYGLGLDFTQQQQQQLQQGYSNAIGDQYSNWFNGTSKTLIQPPKIHIDSPPVAKSINGVTQRKSTAQSAQGNFPFPCLFSSFIFISMGYCFLGRCYPNETSMPFSQLNHIGCI